MTTQTGTETVATRSARLTDRDGDRLGITALPDDKRGPAIWIQTTDDGFVIPVARLRDLIEALQSIAQDAAHAVRQDCQVSNCGPCSFDRAIPPTA